MFLTSSRKRPCLLLKAYNVQERLPEKELSGLKCQNAGVEKP